MNRRTASLLALAAIVVIVVSPVRHTLGRGIALLATGQLAQFQQFLLTLGAWAPAASIGLMIVEALAIPVPVTIIMVANGLVFGVWGGLLVSAAGGLAGAIAAYVIGRSVGRALLERFVSASSLAAADRLMARYGRWAIVIERWIPGIPGDPVSYVAGITRLPAPAFVGLTLAGLLPANLVAAYLGSRIGGDVPLRYWLPGLALAVAAWVAWRMRNRITARAS
ncbi:MAG: TVP38/TMEM64 family protein [Betaproteobacteria bacterium]